MIADVTHVLAGDSHLQGDCHLQSKRTENLTVFRLIVDTVRMMETAIRNSTTPIVSAAGGNVGGLLALR